MPPDFRDNADWMTDEELIRRFTDNNDWMGVDWARAVEKRIKEITSCSDERLSELLLTAIKIDIHYGPQAGFLKKCAAEAALRLDRRDLIETDIIRAVDKAPTKLLVDLSAADGLEDLHELFAVMAERHRMLKTDTSTKHSYSPTKK